MPTDLDNLLAARSAIYAELAAGDIKPSYSINGQQVDWNGRRTSLMSQLNGLNQQITLIQGGFEVVAKGVTG